MKKVITLGLGKVGTLVALLLSKKFEVTGGREWRAISWTTAASIAAVVEMVAEGQLPAKGFIKQEEIPYDQFMETENGQLYKHSDANF